MSAVTEKASLSSVDGDQLSAKQHEITSDEAHLAGLGYKQEFQRAYSPLEVFGIGFSVIGLFPSIAYII